MYYTMCAICVYVMIYVMIYMSVCVYRCMHAYRLAYPHLPVHRPARVITATNQAAHDTLQTISQQQSIRMAALEAAALAEMDAVAAEKVAAQGVCGTRVSCLRAVFCLWSDVCDHGVMCVTST